MNLVCELLKSDGCRHSRWSTSDDDNVSFVNEPLHVHALPSRVLKFEQTFQTNAKVMMLVQSRNSLVEGDTAKPLRFPTQQKARLFY